MKDLEIFLITYNRLEKLKFTLNRILSGPIKGENIKILDNCSDDGTEEFCIDFVEKYPNFTYVRNKINLGISGNIIRAMELASKKWLWVLCDDDDFDWDNWNEIETALNSDQYDIVHTTYSENFRSEDYAYLINEEAFIPTCIYNTKHITPLTMQNAYAMAYTLLPHHAIGCKVINENGKIFVPQKRCVLQGHEDKFNFVRMPRKGLFHKLDDYQILAGYVGAYKLIENERVRNQCNDVLCLGNDFKGSMNFFLKNNPRHNMYNVFEILLSLKEHRQMEFMDVLNQQDYLEFKKLLNIMTARYALKSFWHIRLLHTIFEIKNSKDKKYKLITVLGLKLTVGREKFNNFKEKAGSIFRLNGQNGEKGYFSAKKIINRLIRF